MRASILLVGTAAFALATPALAQSTQEDVAQAANTGEEVDSDLIIVTATKRASTVQDVPFSINAQTEESIQRANAQTLEDLSRNVAGLAVQNLGPGQSQVSVRGVSAGQIVRDQPGVKEQVGVYLDESVVSLSLFTPDFDLFDLNRVETLRGPQGTLFGSGSVGGTIRYITNQPKLEVIEGLLEGNVNRMAGGDTGYHAKGAVNLPIGEKIAVRAVAYGTHYAGFVDAIGPAGGENVNDGQRVGGRVSVLFQPHPDLKITPRVVYQKVIADGFNREEIFNLYANDFTAPGALGRRTQYLKLREKFRDKTLLADLTASMDFGGFEVTSVTSYIDRDILVSRDASALTGSVSIDLAFAPAAVLLPSNLRDTTDLKQWTQELRVGSTGSGPFQWVLGGFYSDVERVYAQRLPTPGYDEFTDLRFGAGTAVAVANGFPLDSPYNADLPYDIKQTAIFGEASYDFGQFKLTGGGRYYDFKETRDFISGGLFSNGDTLIGDKTKSNGFSPRLIGTWEPNRNLSVNVQAAKGFRLGGVNDPLNLPLCSDEDEAIFGPFAGAFDDETLWNYEAGVKYQKGPFTVNAAAFHTRIKDLQVTLDAGSCSSRIVFNVPKAHTTGIELELGARPLPGLDLSFAGSLLKAEFDSTLPGALATSTGIRDGNRLPSVPKFQMAATATYGQRLNDRAEWYVSTSFQHIGNRYTQPADQENNPRTFEHNLAFGGLDGTEATTVNLKLPSYNLMTLSAGLKWDSGLELVAYANNLFDANPKLSFDRERGGRARLGYNIGQPRTIGLTIRQAFRVEPAAPVEPVVDLPPPPPPAPASQTCPDGSVILATEVCPAPAAPPPPPASGQRG
ncbi:TonB-dependent receptor [Sphingomonas sp.]|uniref:TonB-dependent receptor n=1 Tax=Sphingomonas sp. TaxID=28214 RepID=UPI00286E63CF|nr:TonB-dependent receptor [Sphingomonas sp.]